jgi:hypothetical protein
MNDSNGDVAGKGDLAVPGDGQKTPQESITSRARNLAKRLPSLAVLASAYLATSGIVPLGGGGGHGRWQAE